MESSPTRQTVVTSDGHQPADHGTARLGVVCGIAAYGLWGAFPIYFKAVKSVPALEVLAHRIVWSLAFLLLLVLARHRWANLVGAVRCRRTLLTLATTTLLIAGNWLVFIWAVAHDYVLEASLGYFINPLVSILLGFVFLRERLRPWQTFSVFLAVAGVAYLAIAAAGLPWIALCLAFSFGFYGLLRKTARVSSLEGLTVETGLLTPVAVAFMVYGAVSGQAAFAAGTTRITFLLLVSGVLTAIPLLLFTIAARRLRLATMGFLQYLAPTGHFLLAVAVYGEPFTRVHVLTFTFIWLALAIYSVDTLRSVPAQPSAPG
ncbi:MAG: EamA family transporter RarD [Planctomycetes bacterium]|nr:EamA family transporter RarD [Planctomycetota bacterium]